MDDNQGIHTATTSDMRTNPVKVTVLVEFAGQEPYTITYTDLTDFQMSVQREAVAVYNDPDNPDKAQCLPTGVHSLSLTVKTKDPAEVEFLERTPGERRILNPL